MRRYFATIHGAYLRAAVAAASNIAHSIVSRSACSFVRAKAASVSPIRGIGGALRSRANNLAAGKVSGLNPTPAAQSGKLDHQAVPNGDATVHASRNGQIMRR